MNKEELRKSCERLYNDIDFCINDLIAGRVNKDEMQEAKALFQMESFMVATMQQLNCIIDYLKEN